LRHGLSLAGTVTSSNQVVALDFERLLTAGLQSALANPIPASEMEQQASKFQAEIARILKRYNEKGVLVINQKAMIAVPASVDITDKVIRDLGLAP
jgi:Skp family chaperone for outer membrane proteins